MAAVAEDLSLVLRAHIKKLLFQRTQPSLLAPWAPEFMRYTNIAWI